MQVSDTIAVAGAEVFGVDPSSLHSIQATDGVVYSCRKGSRAYVMKFVPMPAERAAGYAEQIAFIHYLVENGVSIAAPIESLAGQLYEILPSEPDPFVVTLSPLASGRNPLYHAVTETIHGGTAQRLEFARTFLESFLDGYLKENDLDPAWLQRLSLFVNYREILVYLELSRDWPEDHRARWQSNFLAEKRARILRGRRCCRDYNGMRR